MELNKIKKITIKIALEEKLEIYKNMLIHSIKHNFAKNEMLRIESLLEELSKPSGTLNWGNKLIRKRVINTAPYHELYPLSRPENKK